MYAIVDQGGSQHKVHEGDLVQIDCAELQAGDTFTFDRVLMYSDEAGDVRIGTPYLANVAVVGAVKSPLRGPKTIAIRFHRRKGVRTRHGHRQTYQQVQISRISADAKAGAKQEDN